MKNTPLEVGTLHFVGIGGIGMSGIAEILQSLNYEVQGSDIKESGNVERLRNKNIPVVIGHDAGNLVNADGEKVSAIIVSSAIKQDNPELVEARRLKIPVVRRADMLAELMRLKTAIAIGGTHGKTTTTSLVGALLEEAHLDPTVINGGIIHAYGTNTRLGQSEWMVAESDESDGSFTRLPATIAVITNIDPEHMDHYGSFEEVKAAYQSFAENIPFYGFAVLCLDHPEVQSLLPKLTDRKCLTYGFSAQANVRGINVGFDQQGAKFDVEIKGQDGEKRILKDMRLGLPGEHNIQNALAAIAIAHEIGISEDTIRNALLKFKGVHRRFTLKGEVHGVRIIDDYGHHPIEIKAVLKAARQTLANSQGRVIALMQPHRYSRLNDLMDDFCNSFNDADTVLVTEVYAAGEVPLKTANSDILVEKIRECGHSDVTKVTDLDDAVSHISSKMNEGDIVICLGAGNITEWAAALPEKLK